MIVGNPSVFAIESEITEAYEELGLRGLGDFFVHVLGHRYGLEADFTMFVSPFEAIEKRIAKRGHHVAPFAALPEAGEIANAFIRAIYTETEEGELFLGLPLPQFEPYANLMSWSEDCGAAFDDGSYVLHLDVEDRARLIAFWRGDDGLLDSSTLRDLSLGQDDFYGILQNWHESFEAEWTALPKVRATRTLFRVD
jgi:hypothetical protein